jgi:hypothetical protein
MVPLNSQCCLVAAVEAAPPNDRVHLRAGSKERNASENGNAGPSSATSWFGHASRYFLSDRRVLPSLSMMTVCSLSVAV